MKILVLLSVLLLSIQSYSQSLHRPTAIDVELQKMDQQRAAISKNQIDLEKRIYLLEAFKKDIMERYEKTLNSWDQSRDQFLWFSHGPGDETLRRDYEKSKLKLKEIASIEEKIDSYMLALSKVGLRLKKQYVKLNEKPSSRESKIKVLESQIENSSVMIDFNQLKSKLDSPYKAAKLVERVYDQKLIGAYMQNKMKNLLNSKVFCSASKQCGAEKRLSISGKAIERELFIPVKDSQNIPKENRSN